MVKIPHPAPSRVELEKLDRIIEQKANSQPPRPYMGMSGIGADCDRQVWADFRHVTRKYRPAWLIDAANCGYVAEDEMIKRLRKNPDLTLITEGVDNGLGEDASNLQVEYSDHDGHFKGHPDGLLIGLEAAPKTWHVWEHKDKARNLENPRSKDKWSQLVKLIQEHGEKQALEKWDYNYYVQAQMYMHYSGLKRHWLTATHGVMRNFVGVRTEYNKAIAEKYIARAKRLIYQEFAPARPYKEGHWYCKFFCDHEDWCHHGVVAEKNCRTCQHSVPLEQGRWGCKKLQISIGQATTQNMSCNGDHYEEID